MESLGASQEQLDLRGVASLEEVARRVKKFAESSPAGSWITGRNWDQSLWPGAAFPTAAILDQAVPGRAVWLKRVDGHAGWASSEAMKLAKVDKATEAPPSGQIIRDSAGDPTGVFNRRGDEPDRASGPFALQGRRSSRRLLAAPADPVLEQGLTSVHDAGISGAVLSRKRISELDHEAG